jgi:hypothetical protein
MRLPCGFLLTPQREPGGGRGRIRTFVARKERQIYSLLVLATHPPVPKNHLGREPRVPNFCFNNLHPSRAKTQKGLVSRDTSPFIFPVGIRSALAPLQNSWWSWRRELNPRPSDYKSDALPAELRQRRSNRVRIAEEVSELQGVAPKYLARGWPALWKIAPPLVHLDTHYPIYYLYFSTKTGQPHRLVFNSRGCPGQKSIFLLEFCSRQTRSDGTIANRGASSPAKRKP